MIRETEVITDGVSKLYQYGPVAIIAGILIIFIFLILSWMMRRISKMQEEHHLVVDGLLDRMDKREERHTQTIERALNNVAEVIADLKEKMSYQCFRINHHSELHHQQ